MKNFISATEAKQKVLKNCEKEIQDEIRGILECSEKEIEKAIEYKKFNVVIDLDWVRYLDKTVDPVVSTLKELGYKVTYEAAKMGEPGEFLDYGSPPRLTISWE